MPNGTFLVGSADDVAAVTEIRNLDEAQLRLNQLMFRVNCWMKNYGLSLSIQKAEILIMTTKQIDRVVAMKFGNNTIDTKEAVSHLGIKDDGKLNFWEHIREAPDKSANLTMKISRLMANTGGPKPTKRRLHMSVIQNILL